MPLFRNLLTQIGLAERRHDPRMDANGLTASCATGSEHKKVRIGNISPTGLYLLTEDRWQPGTAVVLTLGEKSVFEESSRLQVKLWTRCVRVDGSGAGLAFTHSHIDREKWLEAMSRAPSLIAEKNPVQVFRYTRALSFLSHISPASESQILELVSGTLTRERTERVVELALHADDLLESQSHASKIDLAPDLVLRILSLAVEVEEAEIRDYWARLLAAFSLSGSQDHSNLAQMHLLSKLNLLHLRILSAAWLRLIQIGLRTSPSSSPASSPISAPISSTSSASSSPTSPDANFCTVKELEAITGVALAERIEWIVNDLHEFGLLGGNTKPALCGRLAEVDLDLTILGQKFCEQFFGQPQPVRQETHDPAHPNIGVQNVSAHNTSIQSTSVQRKSGQNTSILEQYVTLGSDETMSATASQELSNSLASEAQALRENSGLALMD